MTPEGELRRSRFRDVSENLPAGGHLSTASDLIRFALAWHAGRMVSAASMDVMTAPPASDAFVSFGLEVLVREGGALLRGRGGQDGTRTFLLLNAETGRALAWMTNYERVPGNFNFLVLRTILGLLEAR